MNKITYFEALKWASLFITDKSSPRIYFMDTMDWSNTDLIVHYRDALTVEQWAEFTYAILKLSENCPIQYITNQANFYGRNFYVDQRVLIPRMETEELVEHVLDSNKNKDDFNVLDIGTGSGDISITLKLERPLWKIVATDISVDALNVAKINDKQFKTHLTFAQGSLFKPVHGQQFDLIISNPPYIATTEKNLMDQSVLKYEPKTALFADDDGLYWYKKIADDLNQYLKPQGHLFCEIGLYQGPPLLAYFENKPFIKQVKIIKDINGLDRILYVEKK